MGKQKNKNHRPDEQLLGEIRELKKELRRKDQRIRQLEKELLFQIPKKEKKLRKEDPKCLNCGKGILSVMDLGIRKYLFCIICGDKKRIN